MKIDVYLTWEVRDKHGQLRSYQKRKANSIVGNMLDKLYSYATAASFTIKDTGGTNRSAIYGYYMRMNAGAGDAAWGIVVGTGTNAVTVADNALQTAIANGNGAGQLSYGACSFIAPSTVGSTRSWKIQRTFTNNSGNTISPTEVAIYWRDYYYYDGSASYIFLWDRTLSSATINNGSTGTATYTISITV